MTPTIGVFDSGFGGLTVLRALVARLPGVRFAFLGDTARLPYGSKSRRTIARYAAQSAQFLVREQGAEFLVIACNTASALALDAIQEAVPVPVLGVIEPGAEAARAASRTGDVLVIATDATVQSHAYAAACRARGLRALEKACPLLVPLVEEGWTRSQRYRRGDPYLSGGVDCRCRRAKHESRHAGSWMHALSAAAPADRARRSSGDARNRFRRGRGRGCSCGFSMAAPLRLPSKLARRTRSAASPLTPSRSSSASVRVFLSAPPAKSS